MQLSKEEYARNLICNELKIPSLEITVWHPRDGIFNPNLTAIKDSYKTESKIPCQLSWLLCIRMIFTRVTPLTYSNPNFLLGLVRNTER